MQALHLSAVMEPRAGNVPVSLGLLDTSSNLHSRDSSRRCPRCHPNTELEFNVITDRSGRTADTYVSVERFVREEGSVPMSPRPDTLIALMNTTIIEKCTTLILLSTTAW